MNLGIVTSYFNPCGYRRLRENYYAFVRGLGPLSEHLCTAELVLDDDERLDCPRVRFTQHGKRPDHFMWQKERLLNAAWTSLPVEYDAVAWLDCDVLLPSNWYERATQLLEKKRCVQLFDYATLMEADNESTMYERRGVVAGRKSGSHGAGAWGLAWAARRDDVRLCDWFVAGGADVFMGKVFMGDKARMNHNATAMARCYARWADVQRCRNARDVDYLEGVRLRHLFHGRRENRRYVYRDQILPRCRFDPRAELVADGAAHRWADVESPVAREVRAWFAARREDD